MSKRNRGQRRNDKIHQFKNDHRRHELEWLYAEENERQLEGLRNALIFIWLLACFAAAFLVRDEQAILVWSGGAAVLLVLGYQVRSIWLDRVAEDRIDAELGKRRED